LDRIENSLGPFIGYHGCDKSLAEDVLSGKKTLKKSQNNYDWLGEGIYFWGDSPERAFNWAVEINKKSPKKIVTPSVLGAFIYPGLCLNLTDIGVNQILLDAYNYMASLFKNTGLPIPVNTSVQNGITMRRALDCAVINTIHSTRAQKDYQPFDTVYGVFEEGGPLYPGAGFKEKTHVQIAVREPNCIIGYFRTDST
jgi:hypothetical protein